MKALTWTRHTSFILGAATMALGCTQQDQSGSDIHFESAHSTALNGEIRDGVIYTRTTNRDKIEEEIQMQLEFTVGQFNGINGVADSSRLEIEIGNSEPAENGLRKVHYRATMFIAWDKSLAVPKDYTLILPAQGNEKGIEKFTAAFGADENSGKACLDEQGSEIDGGTFWYYYRPEKPACPLNKQGSFEKTLVVKTPIFLNVSPENTENKSPEYGKVWEDGKLKSILIFGKAEEGAQGDSDVGIAQYNKTYLTLLKTYGTPIRTNVNLNGSLPNAKFPHLSLAFQTPSGLLEVDMFLVEMLSKVSQDFRKKFKDLSGLSDFISYSGHSDLGDNIEAFAKMGHVVPGHYQIILVNGCDTFSYVDETLTQRYQAANPGAQGSKYLDIITNAMPSLFRSNTRSNMNIVNSLVEKQMNYRQILSKFDPYQKAVVIGEQDNTWPNPF
jgi:hypothetical protein